MSEGATQASCNLGQSYRPFAGVSTTPRVWAPAGGARCQAGHGTRCGAYRHGRESKTPFPRQPIGVGVGRDPDASPRRATRVAPGAGNGSRTPDRTSADGGHKVRAAVSALHEVADVLGHTPSVKEYRSIRVRLPELRRPPDATVRRWLDGSWNDCLKALLDTPTDGDFAARRAGVNDKYEDEEVFAALRECAADLGDPPAMTAYFRWARRPDVLERPGRRPTSRRPFNASAGSAQHSSPPV